MYLIKSVLNLISRSPRKITTIQNLKDFKNPVYLQQFRYLSKLEDDSDKIIDDICGGDADLEKKLRILMLEVEVMRQDGRCAPNSLKCSQWQHLISLQSRNQRNSYLLYLWKSEKSRENQKVKKEARKKELETFKPEENKQYADDILYGLSHQSLFLRIRDQSINNFDNYRALQAIQYGQPLVIDCSYEEHMVYRETLNAAKQMTFVFAENRLHKDPFDVHMCNVNNDGEYMTQMCKNIPSIKETWFPLNIHSKSYLEIFPKNKLVYLTPHCREELTAYDHDAVYIIGCMVDKVNVEPLSLAKAKRDGIKMAKLPLDRFLEWAPGSKKNLNINHVSQILLDLKLSDNWEFALRHVPRRKLMETKILAMQNKIRSNNTSKDNVLRNRFIKTTKFNTFSIKDKRSKSKKFLYDDDLF